LAKETFIEDKKGNKIKNLVEICGLFKIGQHPTDDRALASYLSNKEGNIQVWYERLGHISIQKMKELKKIDDKIDFIKSDLNLVPVCNKKRRKKFPSKTKKANELLKIFRDLYFFFLVVLNTLSLLLMACLILPILLFYKLSLRHQINLRFIKLWWKT
jgi:hypothetical protein